MLPLPDNLLLAFRYRRVRWGAWAAAAMFLATCATAALLWWPALLQLDRSEQAVVQARSQVVLTLRQAEFSAAFDGTRRRVEAIREKLEGAASQAELTDHINHLAVELGVRILNESNEEEKALRGYQPVVQELSIEGRYAAIRQFLLALNGLPTWTIVRELRLSRKDVEADLKAVVTLVTYRRRSG